MHNVRSRGQVSIAYLVLFAVAVLLVLILAVRQFARTATTEVWVTRSALAAGERIAAANLVRTRVANDQIPEGAVRDPNTIVGRTLVRPVEKGKPLAARDFSGTARSVWLSDEPPEGRVVLSVPVPPGLPIAQLRRGDRFEVLAVSRQGKTSVVGRDAFMIGSVQARTPPVPPRSSLSDLIPPPMGERRPAVSQGAMILAVRPEDVAPIAQAQTAGATLTFALRGRREVNAGMSIEISPRSPGQVELITGAHSEKVNVN